MGSLDITLTWPVISGTVLAVLVSTLIWRRYWTSISDIPGPFLASLTRLWHIASIARGKQNLDSIELHNKLGMLFHPISTALLTHYPTWYDLQYSYQTAAKSRLL